MMMFMVMLIDLMQRHAPDILLLNWLIVEHVL